MKNIYNLITDAFVRIGRDESVYSITIQYTEFGLRSYRITITPLGAASASASASVVLLLNSSDMLVDYYEVNDLFEEEPWQRFCDVFEWEI